jgi:acyl-CoA synthetase (AMP-forming)/AMP-acid ligase II
VGEIVVRGPVATRRYYGRDAATRLAKIADRDGGFWHRMGDVGYLDERGRLWFCGRKAHRVVRRDGGTSFPVMCEGVFNTHPDVYRTALVGVDAEPVLVVERHPDRGRDRARLVGELRALGAQHAVTKDIERVLFHDAFPVDIRHNAKIFREQLAVWAAGELA